MNTRKGFASCAVMALLAVANIVAAQQPREPRQDRRAKPKQAEPPVETTLFEQADVPYQVLHVVSNGNEVCQILMVDKAAETAVLLETNAGDHTAVTVINTTDPPPASYARVGAQQRLRVEVDGVAQTYSIKNMGPQQSLGLWAVAVLSRAALRHPAIRGALVHG